ncbi:MAG: hypothetical protein PHP87_07145 [Syntrophomonas sp.]|uniref:DUF7408 domain-containing protein n=1 Tax=Syntrophomonas sp. TaxID=2053627 RepID=UPI00263610D7|nr:hypothetical protein [Syntrophomonas sp.]MDD4626848.1 hypothetical protein [Syntrophomonas sp.]
MKKMMQLSFSILLGLFLLLGSLPPATAEAAGQVEMTAEAGFKGFARWGQAFPLQVTLLNPGPEIRGQLVFDTNNNELRIQQQKEIVLPTGSKKRINMFIPANQTANYEIKLMAGEKEVAKCKSRVTIMQPQEMLVGVLASGPSTLDHLGGIKFPAAGQRISVTHLEAKDIPEKSLLLDNLDILALNDFSSSSLSKGQLKAIEDWVQRGGMLVLGGGPNWKKTFFDLPETLWPVGISSTRQLSALSGMEKLAGERLEAKKPFIISEGQLRSGKVLLSSGETPVVVEDKRGRGNILYLAYDLALQPFGNWTGNNAFWSNLILRINPHQMAGSSGRYVSSVQDMGWILRNFPASDLPSAGWLALVLLAYIILLGPGIYLFLKKYDRRDWAWALIPVLAVLLFSLTYLGAFKAKGRDVFTNVITLVKLQPDLDRAEASTYAGVFAPTRKEFSFELQGQQVVDVIGGDMGHMMHRTVSVMGGNNSGQYPLLATVSQDERTRVSFDDASRWSMRCIALNENIEQAGRIEAQLKTSQGKIKGIVKNKSDRTLSNCIVLNRYGYQRISKILPGQSVEVEFAPRFSPNRGPTFYRIFERYPVYRPQGYQEEANWERQWSTQILENATRNGQFLDDSIMFIGFSKDPASRVFVPENRGKVNYNSIYLAPLELKLASEKALSIPPGIINGRFTATDGRNFNQDPWGIGCEGGFLEFELDLPFSREEVKIDEFKLYVGSNDYRRAYLMKLMVYNFHKGRWEDLSYQPGGMLLTDWKPYVSEKDTLQVKIGSGDKGPGYVNISGITLSLEGEYISPQAVPAAPEGNNMEGGE